MFKELAGKAFPENNKSRNGIRGMTMRLIDAEKFEVFSCIIPKKQWRRCQNEYHFKV